MASFLGSVANSIVGSAISRTMKKLEATKAPIRLEVENDQTTFYTVFSMRPSAVVFSKPADLGEKVLRPGGFVRFVVPDGSKRVVRLKITDPHFKRVRGDYVFLCEHPEDFEGISKRAEDRFNTTRFQNLQLYIPEFDGRFRIIDISRSGCKAYIPIKLPEEYIELGRPIRFSRISVGRNVEIELDVLTPRFMRPPSMCFSWDVSTKEPSPKFMAHLINSLQEAERGRLKIKEKMG